jgi:hypothetical protein
VHRAEDEEKNANWDPIFVDTGMERRAELLVLRETSSPDRKILTRPGSIGWTGGTGEHSGEAARPTTQTVVGGAVLDTAAGES